MFNSNLPIPHVVATCYARGMNVKDVRAKNLELLVAKFGEGVQAKFARLYGFNSAHVSQMITRSRDMGDKVARKCEAKFKLQPGAMDFPIERLLSLDDPLLGTVTELWHTIPTGIQTAIHSIATGTTKAPWDGTEHRREQRGIPGEFPYIRRKTDVRPN